MATDNKIIDFTLSNVHEVDSVLQSRVAGALAICGLASVKLSSRDGFVHLCVEAGDRDTLAGTVIARVTRSLADAGIYTGHSTVMGVPEA